MFYQVVVEIYYTCPYHLIWLFIKKECEFLLALLLTNVLFFQSSSGVLIRYPEGKQLCEKQEAIKKNGPRASRC